MQYLNKSFLLLALAAGLFSQITFAQKNNDEGLNEVCSLSSGSWHRSASGWACCWSRWGCYGCTNGNCLMNCKTTECKTANGMSKVTSGKMAVPGLAPRGTKPPIVPVRKPRGPAAGTIKLNYEP